MEIKNSIKKSSIALFISIIILIISSIYCKLNMNQFNNTDDFVKSFAWIVGNGFLINIVWIIIVQIAILFLVLINRKNNTFINVLVFLLALAHFAYTNFSAIPFIALNILEKSKGIETVVVVLFEIVNIYAIINIIKRIHYTKKKTKRSK